MTKKRILLIGSGRLATHLQFWNSQLSNPNTVLAWDRHQDPHLLKSYLEKTDLVWLAISDNAIISFYNKYLVGQGIPTVHFSGALHDPSLICAHPMMSFPSSPLNAETYNKIYFGLTGVTTLNEVLPGFTNSFFLVPPEDKPLYHALCVMAGNFPQILWSKTFDQFKHIHVPDQAFENYIKQITENFVQLKQKALTGPLIRKDENTISANLNSLQTDPSLQNIYQSFLKEFRK